MEEPKVEPSGEIPEPEEEPFEKAEINSAPYSVMSGFQSVLSIAIVMATLLTLWNPRKLLSTPNLSALLRAEAAQSQETGSPPEDTSNHIGLLAGHWKDNPGEVCSDGLIEADVNQAIAARVSQTLTDMGYKIDIFPEYDLSLLNYRSTVFVAIYSGSCADSPLPPSGFKVATSLTAQIPDKVNQLAVCLSEEYRKATKLPFTYEVLNPDHHSFHIFRDIHTETPAVLIEVGSLKTDRSIIVSQAGKVSDGIVAGILCYLDGQSKTGK
jgi:N-acetylmuramoyl-L-alanine amidase